MNKITKSSYQLKPTCTRQQERSVCFPLLRETCQHFSRIKRVYVQDTDTPLFYTARSAFMTQSELYLLSTDYFIFDWFDTSNYPVPVVARLKYLKTLTYLQLNKCINQMFTSIRSTFSSAVFIMFFHILFVHPHIKGI